MLLYSGREDDQHQERVAIILMEGLEKTLIDWKPINNRLISARLKGTQISISISHCYAPTNDASDEIKDAYDDQLQHELDKTPYHDIKSSSVI